MVDIKRSCEWKLENSVIDALLFNRVSFTKLKNSHPPINDIFNTIIEHIYHYIDDERT